MKPEQFQQLIYDYYHEHGRSFPWRDTEDPYRILVSEVMLQQTQTSRVIEKYQTFLEKFPTVTILASASVSEVLSAWQGLGYNRRGLNLQRAAQKVVETFAGEIPTSVEDLDSLPGIGYATACAIAAFAYQEPVVFIETNIRRVYLHNFFPGQEGISDKELLPLIEATLDKDNPRHWYYALMDYGAWLVKQFPNPNRRSKHYSKQAAFTGSNRQIRGGIIRYLVDHKHATILDLVEYLHREPEDVKRGVSQLQAEGFLQENDESITLV